MFELRNRMLHCLSSIIAKEINPSLRLESFLCFSVLSVFFSKRIYTILCQHHAFIFYLFCVIKNNRVYNSLVSFAKKCMLTTKSQRVINEELSNGVKGIELLNFIYTEFELLIQCVLKAVNVCTIFNQAFLFVSISLFLSI